MREALFLCVCTAALLLGGLAVNSRASGSRDFPEDPSFPDDTWHMEMSPYLWIAGMAGTVSVKGHTARVEQSFSDIFQNLKLGIMGLAEIRRGRLGVITNVMWIRLGDEPALAVEGFPVGVNVKTSLYIVPSMSFGEKSRLHSEPPP